MPTVMTTQISTLFPELISAKAGTAKIAWNSAAIR